MAVSTRRRRADGQSGPFKKIAVAVLIAGPFLAAGGYGITESDLPGWASGVLLLVGIFLATLAMISVGRVIPSWFGLG